MSEVARIEKAERTHTGRTGGNTFCVPNGCDKVGVWMRDAKHRIAESNIQIFSVTLHNSEEYLLEIGSDADVLKLIQAFPAMKQIGRNQHTFCEIALPAFDVLRFVSD